MAFSDSLNQFAKRPPSYQLSVFLLIFALIFLLYYQLIYSSMVEERDSMATQKSMLLDQQSKLNADLNEYRKLSEDYDKLQQDIRDNQRALPTEAELPSFFDHLQRKAGDAGVTIRRWDRREEKTVDIYIRVPVDVEIVGTYNGIKKYFSLLGPQSSTISSDSRSSRLDERIVSIENLTISDAQVQDGEIVLVARFTASTFRQQGPAATPNLPGAPQPPGTPPSGPAARAVQKVEAAGQMREQRTDQATGTAPSPPSGGQGAPPPPGGDRAQQGVDRVKNPGADIP